MGRKKTKTAEEIALHTKECQIAWRERNKEVIKAKHALYYQQNKERIKARVMKYEQEHHEEQEARRKAYRERNPEKWKEYYIRNRHKIGKKMREEQKAELFRSFGYDV